MISEDIFSVPIIQKACRVIENMFCTGESPLSIKTNVCVCV